MDRILRRPNEAWLEQLFSAKAVERGGVVRRSVLDVEREIGRERLKAAVLARGFHLVECGGQFIVICNQGHMRVLV
ncbi:N-(5'-phosphoribosyl)anthranilate isomerase [Pseudoroseicyclus sp. CXY001]|uniref:N-(5'-phosphoribosyl)anthranilate isomerase n=1 Tax=Pseudoroseicyclus sp. CXY001 TaxID=3242492 RepID=UPI0035713137